jgi:hypothetical protein
VDEEYVHKNSRRWFHRVFLDKLGTPYPGALNPQQMESFLDNAAHCYALCTIMTERPSWGQIWARARPAPARSRQPHSPVT